MEFFVYFMIGYMTTWIIGREINFLSEKKKCPLKDQIHGLVLRGTSDKLLLKQVKHYSLLKIQDGHFEYREVLESLKEKGKENDKARA